MKPTAGLVSCTPLPPLAPGHRRAAHLFAVDLFDIPSIDTVLLLRTTESAVVTLQQLGRGLRLSPDTGKSCLTVLDFIGQQHRRFRFDQRFRALLGGSRRQLESGGVIEPFRCLGVCPLRKP